MNIENRAEWLSITGGESTAVEAAKPRTAEAGGFGDELTRAVHSLDKLQTDADSEVRQVAMGSGNLHEMAIALEKADIGMRFASKVRTKIVDAYHEIVKMGV